MSAVNLSSICSGLAACWRDLGACAVACAQQYNSSAASCAFRDVACVPQDSPGGLSAAAAAAALTVVSTAGGFVCAAPVGDAEDSGKFGNYLLLGIAAVPAGALCYFFAMLLFWPHTPELLARPDEPMPPISADWHVWPKHVRSELHAQATIAGAAPATLRSPLPQRLSWRERVALEAERLQSLEAEAAKRCRAPQQLDGAVYFAVLGRWDEVVQRVREEPSAASCLDLYGWCALHHAARLGAEEHVLQTLLDAAPACVEAKTRESVDGFLPLSRVTDMQAAALGVAVLCAAVLLPLAAAVGPYATLTRGSLLAATVFLGALVVFALAVIFAGAAMLYDGAHATYRARLLLNARNDSGPDPPDPDVASSATEEDVRKPQACWPHGVQLFERWRRALQARFLPLWLHAHDHTLCHAPARTPLAVAAGAYLRAHHDDSDAGRQLRHRLAKCARLLIWCAPHTVLGTRLLDTRLGRRALRDVLLSDRTLLWRPAHRGAAQTLIELAVALYDDDYNALYDAHLPPPCGSWQRCRICCVLLRRTKVAPLHAWHFSPLRMLLDLHEVLCVPLPARLTHYGGSAKDAQLVRDALLAPLGEEFAFGSLPVLYAGTGAPVLLGAGGYGEVRLHRGETGWPGVAVKVLNEKRSALLLEDSAQGTTLLRRAASAAEREAALVTETLALSVVSHRHVVHLFTAAMRGGKLHIFMALAPGGDLASAFDAAPAHTAWRAQGWRLTCEVASGLAYLHAREPPIFHRDVKPANILLSACLPHGHAQLTDFGISSSTRFGAADGVGTEVWAAPEVRGGSGGGTADGAAPPAAICFAKADVFPVGLLVYKFVTQARDQQMLNLRPTLRLIPCPACGEWLARAGDTMRCAEAECVQDDACSADAAELACAAAAKLAGRPDLNELRRLLACCEPALAAAAGEETDTPAAATAAGTSEQDGDTAPCCSDSVSVAFMDD